MLSLFLLLLPFPLLSGLGRPQGVPTEPINAGMQCYGTGLSFSHGDIPVVDARMHALCNATQGMDAASAQFPAQRFMRFGEGEIFGDCVPLRQPYGRHALVQVRWAGPWSMTKDRFHAGGLKPIPRPYPVRFDLDGDVCYQHFDALRRKCAGTFNGKTWRGGTHLESTFWFR